MCAACIDFKDPDAPPVAVIIANTKKQLRRQRTLVWGLRVVALLLAGLVWVHTWWGFNGHPNLLVWIVAYLYGVWLVLAKAEIGAGRVDHTKKHLRLTEALQDPGCDIVADDIDKEGPTA